ncbi:hypothetical protein STCU_06532 [Strigomonas culicis]|uniref:Mitochondrial import inner membrane translocase subunit TIM50 n=1 Tax=Strigomonas culicis TaxID=28005 RepID=S9VF92_9TRYP|nr:hypothetical protein STCU_06532 [Strigomonas culicis]|eukprot:EPY25711.1 hypothetical protein STCU_06532 [Strigomonas culicis]
MRRQPTTAALRQSAHRALRQCGQKYTVVFDLDETVVYARDGPLYSRAYLKDLLRAIKDDFEVIVWTAGERDYAKNVLEEINDEHIIQHLIYRHCKWFNEEDYTKDLKKLGRDMDYTIMVENTPDCVRANPQNSIIVEDFEVAQQESFYVDAEAILRATANSLTDLAADKNAADGSLDTATSSAPVATEALDASPDKPKRIHKDRTLFLLKEVLLSLVKSGKTVPDFLAGCELLTKETVVGSNEKEIPIYHLGTRRKRKDAGTPRKAVKENRDLVRNLSSSQTTTPQPPSLSTENEAQEGSRKRDREDPEGSLDDAAPVASKHRVEKVKTS